MPTYSSIDAMWYVAVKQLVERQATQESRDGLTTEILAYEATLREPTRSWLANPRRALSPAYAAAEVLWYFSGSDDVRMISRYAPQYSRMAQPGTERAYGAYGKRLMEGFDQVTTVVSHLKKYPDSRRCVVSLWRADDLSDCTYSDIKDVPCTLTWQFLLRHGRLHMIVTMRSQDVWLGMPYDVFWNCLIMRVVARELGVAVGDYHHRCGSIHLYDRNWAAAREVLKSQPALASQGLWVEPNEVAWVDTVRSMKAAAYHEEILRQAHDKGVKIKQESFESFGIIGQSMLGLCCNHLGIENSFYVDPVLKQAEKVHADHRRLRPSRKDDAGA